MLSDRAVNRATLERQMLLRRHTATVEEAIARSVAVNAQTANAPYHWLWARLAGVRRGELTRALEGRTVVRSTLLRSTQHIVAAGDFGWLRARLRPLLARVQRNTWGARSAGVDLDELVAETRRVLAGRTLTRPELDRLLAERWPGRAPQALAWSVQYLEPMLHPAPSGTWGVGGPTPFVLASDWLGEDGGGGHGHGADGHGEDDAADRLVRRYLAAYGPATVSDIRAWSGVAGLREVVARLRPGLRTFRSEAGKELLDLPDAPRPDPDVPAPVRLLPEFDNLMLAHHDRRRVMSDDARRRVSAEGGVYPTVLVDGRVRALWSITRPGEPPVVTVTPFERLSPAVRDEIGAEAESLLAFAADDPGEPGDVRILPPD